MMTILFPQNRSFVRVKAAADNAAPMPGFAGMPMPPGGLPPGIGPQAAAPQAPVNTIGPTNLPGMPGMPGMPSMPTPSRPNMPSIPSRPNMPQMPAGMPAMPGAPQMPGSAGMPAMPMGMPPMMMMESTELKATGQTTNLLGYTCTGYELKQRGETLEIWATDKLMPFQPWLPNQPHRFPSRMIEDQWPEMMKAKKLFPLLATLKFENGAERFRFAVSAVTPEQIRDEDGSLFQPPPDYHEMEPLPF
jgi:hypothetical protein